MRDVVIKAGVYGHRTDKGRVLPVAKGERVTLPDEEAARLVDLGVAAYADVPAEDPGTPPNPPAGSSEEPPRNTPGGEPASEGNADGEEGDPDDAAEMARLERMQRSDLEQMAADLGVDAEAVSGAKNKHDLAVLIMAASEPDDGEAPPTLGAGDIVE